MLEHQSASKVRARPCRVRTTFRSAGQLGPGVGRLPRGWSPHREPTVFKLIDNSELLDNIHPPYAESTFAP